MHWRRKWQPTPVFLPGESRGWESLVGCRLWGHTESDTTEVTWQQHMRKKKFVRYCAAAAKLLQACPTLCSPIDGSPPDSPVPEILQASILVWVAISFSNECMHAKSLQSCPTLWDPMDSSPPGSSVHGILYARMLEWPAISFSIIQLVWKKCRQSQPLG